MSKKKKNSKNKNASKYFDPKIITIILLLSCYFCYHIFGVAYIIIVLILIIFINLDHNKNTNGQPVSAYSIFNKDKKYLIGDLRMNQIENELRHTKATTNDDSDNFLRYDDIQRNKMHIKGYSKYNNKLCTCGSNKKFKKCCGRIKNDSSGY
ncbi:conserved protein, unknown function [Plasmodium berghei]|uniref:SAYSvFN domain-containing protein, putative n=2 Tax=Plasmodium berghei TaxID=5821 RepID=A0A509AHM2_PLABA|nr:SAYSvFN domain-containing protein, putative [Plasmodium berghei ANKA]CXI23513.1 conserved protein, unknown function [Plasmodium berghei]SCM20205.1 conserved protein, unknown function [Plasmodium berghei]SCN23832.1 conserved protein, unknown function [Plasmodium berghei]SCO59261.1 conserved protein, unknown function [Plasmodium berghei]SCO60227.1 conserved protein, unknown function [Plasmodium berghei]|eukprot:XP_034420799.1 SAYSvFN domain-containing protein, putative [Plasmodium berghei ANKA]